MTSILIVEDDNDINNLICNTLKAEGYQCERAFDGKEGADKIEQNRYDLLLLDIMLPEINGYELLDYVRRIGDTPVIIISAMGQVDERIRGLRMGADDYIAKPFSIHLLKGKIANQLKARQRLKHYYSNTIDIDTAKMTSNNLDEEFMSKAIQVVEENISNEDFTSDELASQLCMSRSSLYLKMNSISGEPPANFIRRIRFNKACKLLLEGRYSISEISGMVGFGSSSYFSTSFKKYVGCLPSEYVKQHTK